MSQKNFWITIWGCLLLNLLVLMLVARVAYSKGRRDEMSDLNQKTLQMEEVKNSGG